MSDLSRVEQLLRNVLGEDAYEVTPQSRVEVLLAELNELIEGMGGGSVSPEDIATAVAAYLDEHLTNPTNPPVDTSLAIAGAAADAKKTGDEISELKSGLSDVESDISEKERTYLGTLTMGYWKQSNLNEYGSKHGRFITADASGGEIYYISGTCVNRAFPLAIMVDAGNTVLGTIYTSDNDAVNDYELKVPTTCTKVYVNGRRWDGGAGFNYPSIYKYSYGANAVDINSKSIPQKQSKVNRWIKSPIISEAVNRYMYLQSGTLHEQVGGSASGYNYKKIAYNKDETYRFYGLCRAVVIPIVICCDEYDNIIKLYGYTVGDAFKGEVITDIPQTTKYIYVNGLSYLESSAEVARERSLISLVTHKVGVCLGDSITQGGNVYVNSDITPYKDYPSIISDLLDCTIYNGGLGGATYASGRTIDFVNVVNCIVSGDYSTVISGIDQYGLNQSAKVQYASIADLDFKDVDFITLAYGTNDWNFGTGASAIATAMQSGISALLTAYPHLKIYVFTPIYRFNIKGSGEDSDTFVNPTSGLKLHDVCEAIMDCAKAFNVPCKDMYYECNINQYNKALYMGDDTHPNANGYALMGDKFGKYINSN